MKKASNFMRRGPDLVTLELAEVMRGGESYEFKPLFLTIHANLRARNAAGGGEEMLRLRTYEKLQNLVRQGVVEKTGKEYRGNIAGLAAFSEQVAAQHEAAVQRSAAVTAVATAAKRKAAAEAEA